MDRNMFDRAIGDPPPSTVDVEAIIARGRRAALIHRVANPWTAAAATVAVLAVGAALLLPGHSANPGAGVLVVPASPSGSGSAQSPTPTTTTSATTLPLPPGMHCVTEEPIGPPPAEDPNTAAGRLTGVLTAAVQQRLAAGTQLTPNSDHFPKGVSVGPLRFYYDQGQATTYCPRSGIVVFGAAATTVNAGHKGNIYVSIHQRSNINDTRNICATTYGPGVVSDMAGTCRRQPDGPHGEVVIFITNTSKRPGGGPTINEVDITKADGTAIELYAENVGDSAKFDGRPETPQPPLSHEQLAAIALDPGMTLYPH
jgi:hypothetical protein